MIWGQEAREMKFRLKYAEENLSFMRQQLDYAHDRINRLIESLDLVEVLQPATPTKTVLKKKSDLNLKPRAGIKF